MSTESDQLQFAGDADDPVDLLRDACGDTGNTRSSIGDGLGTPSGRPEVLPGDVPSPSPTRPEGTDPGRIWRSWDDIEASPIVPAPVLPGLAWRGRYSALVADSKVGKTAITSHALACALRRDPFLDTVPGAERIGVMQEMGADLMKALLTAHHVERQHAVDRIDFLDRASYVDLRAYIEERKPNLLVVDTLSMLAAANRADENNQKDMQLLNAVLLVACREHGVSVLVVHHENRSGTYRGSSVIKADVDMLIEMKMGDHGLRRLTYSGRWQQQDLELEFSKATRKYAVAGEDDAPRKVLQFIRDNPGCSKAEARQGTHMGRTRAYEAINILSANSSVVNESGKLFEGNVENAHQGGMWEGAQA